MLLSFNKCSLHDSTYLLVNRVNDVMTSGYNLKYGAPAQVLRKVLILTKFGLRENVKIKKILLSFILCIFWPCYATYFIDVSI